MENLENNYSPYSRSFIGVVKEDEEKVKRLLNENKIFITNIFNDPYEQALKENVEFFIYNRDEGFLNPELAEKINEMDIEEREDLMDRSIYLLYDNEYLSQTLNECTTDAIEGGVRELFIKKEMK